MTLRFLTGALRDLLTSAPEPDERFGLGQFVRRVAELEGVDAAAAYPHVLVVFVALGQAVVPQELRDMAAQLPKELDPLLVAARRGVQRAMPQDHLAMSVAHLTPLGPRQARAPWKRSWRRSRYSRRCGDLCPTRRYTT